jgi:hypothetical protein
MVTAACPSCGAEIGFRSAIAVSAVCPYCRTLVVRHGTDIAAIGQCAVLPSDVSPFQLGTTGLYTPAPGARQGFTLIGRIRMAWEDGGWNEWLMLFDDGRQGWLAEAQGSLAVSLPLEQPPLDDDLVSTLHLKQSFFIMSRSYTVTDIKTARYAGYEGEFVRQLAPPASEVTVVDMTAEDGGFASVSYGAQEAPLWFLGSYVPFDAFGFSNLREVPGWGLPTRQTAAKA